MRQVGMAVEIDPAGNLRGLYPGSGTDATRLIIGSHLDTIPNGGAFDGVLGVVLGVALHLWLYKCSAIVFIVSHKFQLPILNLL